MGRYNVVVEDDENVVWEKDEVGKVTHILFVGFIVFFLNLDSDHVQENDHENIVASAIPPSFHHRSVSLGSRSGSVPRSASIASGSHGQSLASSIDTSEVTGPSKLSKEKKALLLEYLGIDAELPSLGPPGLCSNYQKFKAIIKAIPQVMGLGRDAEWKSQFDDGSPWIPNVIQFIEIFIAKSQFYQFWKPFLSRAQEYPNMKDWLNQHEDCMSTTELWSIDSNQSITFSDLKKWLDDKDRAVDMKKQDPKGKRKAVGSPPKSKKNSDRDRPVVQRKQKKSRPENESDESE